MSASSSLEIPSELETAQRFLQALRDGRVVDALDAFAPDAIIREGEGMERRGLRAIAGSLLPYRVPGRVEIVEIHRSVHGVTARLHANLGIGDRSRDYRATFQISGNRIRALDLRPS